MIRVPSSRYVVDEHLSFTPEGSREMNLVTAATFSASFSCGLFQRPAQVTPVPDSAVMVVDATDMRVRNLRQHLTITVLYSEDGTMTSPMIGAASSCSQNGLCSVPDAMWSQATSTRSRRRSRSRATWMPRIATRRRVSRKTAMRCSAARRSRRHLTRIGTRVKASPQERFRKGQPGSCVVLLTMATLALQGVRAVI